MCLGHGRSPELAESSSELLISQRLPLSAASGDSVTHTGVHTEALTRLTLEKQAHKKYHDRRKVSNPRGSLVFAKSFCRGPVSLASWALPLGGDPP